MSGIPGTAVIQITNLSPAVSSEQMRTLFGFLGDIEELRLYPPDNAPLPFSSKVCYIKYREPSSVGVAQHLTNTVFIDRALIVVPCAEGKIPEEAKALSLLAPATTVGSLMPGAGLLPIPTPAPLPSTTTAEQLLEYFKQVGDVKFVRMAGDETQPTRFAFVEFADQESVPRALAFNGVMFGDRPLKINHSNNAIVKPPELTPQAAAKELEDVMKRVREAQSFISAAIEPAESVKSSSVSSKKAVRSRSRSRSGSRSQRKRSHSRHSHVSRRSQSKAVDSQSTRGSHKTGSQSKERGHSRSRSPSRDRRKDKDGKSKSKEESSKEKDERRLKDKKGKTPPKSYSSSRRSRSTSRSHRKRTRSRSKSPQRSRTPKRKVKSPSPRRGKKEKKKEKGGERGRYRGYGERSTSRKKIAKDREKHERMLPHLKVERDYDREERDCERDQGGAAPIQHNGSYSKHDDELSAKPGAAE
ncbi:splicing regulatory glutamine/lysine-rich protein 1 isoform X2 [Amia ocellicauda]|uniref:splicing regulatory glutamine/lysine-rich protein 1 isoform X2 n=1 Tax=Amia ocellicauda TaxID=2972642 RepID=UPI003463FADB